jgi:rubrerythrin
MTNETGKLTTWENILHAALRKERAAYRFYDEILSTTKVRLLRQLLETLRGEEAKHIDMVQKKIAQMNLGRS